MLCHSVVSDWDLSLALNPWYLVSGRNEAEVLDVLLQKKSVRDTAIGKRWIVRI